MSDGPTEYGFNWGPVVVERITHLDGRGYWVSIRGRKDYQGPEVQVLVSEKGRVVTAHPLRGAKATTREEGGKVTIAEAYHRMRSYFTQEGAVIAREDGSWGCKYRTYDGNKCAVGCLIDDEHYKLHWDSEEGVAAEEIIEDVFGFAATSEFTKFCLQAQSAHDHSGTANEFVQRLDALAQHNFHLEVPS